MATTRDYYDILGVPRGAADAEIKRAFRKLAQQWHPDVNTDPAAQERFKEINEAYQVLSDPQQRRAYDMFGQAGVGGGGPEGFGPFGGFQGFGDLFDAFFGGARPGRPGPACPSAVRVGPAVRPAGLLRGVDPRCREGDRVQRAGPLRHLLGNRRGAGVGVGPLPPVQRPGRDPPGPEHDAGADGQCHRLPALPGEGSVVETPCHECHGEGRIQHKRKLRVVIPAGIDEGHQMRLTGEGEAGPRGGPAGNLYVAVHVEEHPVLRRETTELFFSLPLSITQAALGARVTVPTAEGEEEIEVKAGTQPGAEIRLRGRGVPHLRRPGVRGDLHLQVDVQVPTRLSKRQRELLEALAAESGERPAPKSGGIFDKVKDAIS